MALLSALLGAGCLHIYLQGYEDEVRGGDMVSVLSLTRDVTPGTVLGEDLLDVRSIPERYLDERHVPVADLPKVEGNRVQVGLLAGDALLWTDLGLSEGVAQLSRLVPVGRRAVRVRGSEVAFGGLLRPGDRVDVLLTEDSQIGEPSPPRTTLLLENVMVLAVGDQVGGRTHTNEASNLYQEFRGRPSNSVTLDVTPTEARRFESHRRRGAMSLALRNPDDLTVASLPGGSDVR